MLCWAISYYIVFVDRLAVCVCVYIYIYKYKNKQLHIYYHCIIRKCHCINCLNFINILLNMHLCIIL